MRSAGPASPEAGRLIPIVEAQLRDPELIANDSVDHAVFTIDSARPVTLQGMLQRLRLADAGKRLAHDLLDKLVDPPEPLGICLLPIQILLPRRG